MSKASSKTDARRQFIQTMIIEGYTDDEIMRAQEIPQTTLWRWRREVEICGGVRRRRVARGHETQIRAGRMLANGASMEELIGQLGISYSSALRLVSEHGGQSGSQAVLQFAPRPVVETEPEPDEPVDVRGLVLHTLALQMQDPQTTPERLAQMEAARMAMALIGGTGER